MFQPDNFLFIKIKSLISSLDKVQFGEEEMKQSKSIDNSITKSNIGLCLRYESEGFNSKFSIRFGNLNDHE